jgi:hypothetical protein
VPKFVAPSVFHPDRALARLANTRAQHCTSFHPSAPRDSQSQPWQCHSDRCCADPTACSPRPVPLDLDVEPLQHHPLAPFLSTRRRGPYIFIPHLALAICIWSSHAASVMHAVAPQPQAIGVAAPCDSEGCRSSLSSSCCSG